MTKLSSKFGFNDAIRTKTFEIKGNKFTVRVPTSNEKLVIDKSIIELDEAEINSRYEKMTEVFRKSVAEEQIEGIELKEDDVIIDGMSAKETVSAVLRMEKRILKYFQMLIPEDGSSEDFTYEDIESELPLQLQLEIVEKISEAIEPNYRDARKN